MTGQYANSEATPTVRIFFNRPSQTDGKVGSSINFKKILGVPLQKDTHGFIIRRARIGIQTILIVTVAETQAQLRHCCKSNPVGSKIRCQLASGH